MKNADKVIVQTATPLLQQELDSFKGTLKLRLPGDLLSTNADAHRQEIFAVLESQAVKSSDWKRLEIDLSQAKMVDSAGLNLLVAITRLAKNRAATLAVKITSLNIQRTFSFTRLDQQIEVLKV